MAKMSCHYSNLCISAEGEEKFVGEITDKMLGFVTAHNAKTEKQAKAHDAEIKLTETIHTDIADCDIVAIYDDAGIPSIMHRLCGYE